MPNSFDCPNCGQKLTAKPEMAGVIIDCPSCGSQVQVPAFHAPVPMAPPTQQFYPQQMVPQSYGQPQPYPQQFPVQQNPYGYPPQPTAPYPTTMREPSGKSYHSLALTAFICSFFIAIVGLILGIVALNGMKESGNTEGKGLATAAVCISAVWMGIAFFAIVANS